MAVREDASPPCRETQKTGFKKRAKEGISLMKGYTHNRGTFIGKGGIEIFFQAWTVERPRGVVVIAHGLGEHSGRYGNIVEKLQGSGISVYALDHRGFGQSGGARGHVDSFMDYIHDLKLLMSFSARDTGGVPSILLGHSMGAVIACMYALEHPGDVSGLILSSGAFVLSAKVPAWKLTMGRFFSKHYPGLTLANGLDATALSHDDAVVRAYVQDPLVHDRVTARFSTEFFGAMETCFSRAVELKMPLLVFHGSEDGLTDCRGSETVFSRASTPAAKKELHIFPGLYHETMNESGKEREKVLRVVYRWITAAARGRKASAAKGLRKTKKQRRGNPRREK